MTRLSWRRCCRLRRSSCTPARGCCRWRRPRVGAARSGRRWSRDRVAGRVGGAARGVRRARLRRGQGRGVHVVAQGRDEQGTPGRPPGHRGPLDRRDRVPGAGAPVQGQQGRDEDADPGPDRVPGASRRARHRRCGRRRDAVRGEPARAGRAGFAFIVGSRISKAPYDLAEHFRSKGNVFTDGQCLETTRPMGTGKAARERGVVHQYKFKRSQHDKRSTR